MTTDRGGRWRRGILAVSLAFNLLVLGAVGAALLRHGPDDRASEAERRDLALGPYLRALDDPHRAALMEGLRARSPDLQARRAAFRQSFDGVLVALRADPFDPQGFRALIADQARSAQATRDLGHDLLAARVAAMTPQERRAFADRLAAGLHHRAPR